MLKWSWEVIELPLKFKWSISRNSSIVKRNFIITVADGDGLSGRGEVAFNIRYGESEELIKEQLAFFSSKAPKKLESLESFHQSLEVLKLANSLRFGLEAAAAELMAKQNGILLSEFLGQPNQASVPTSFSLPIMPLEDLADFIEKHQLARFSSLKVKVEKLSAVKTVQEVLRLFPGKLRIDANESWQTADEVLSFIEQVEVDRLEFLEQPLPAEFHSESVKLKEDCPCILIADESITEGNINVDLCQAFDGVNIKLMKSGGHLKALAQIAAAKKMGLKLMLGCMIETSLGISHALAIAGGIDYIDLDGFLLLENDPFGLVKESGGKLQYS